jgi:hypothetical protein
VIATGRNAAPFDQSRNEEEFKKTLGSALIAGHSLIAIDNCVHILESSLLNIAVTEPVFGVRVLGVSQNREIPNNATIFVNDNNLIIGADLTRRVIRCEMDAGMERPEQREFKDDHLLDTVKTNRVTLVVAGLTVLRAWHVARPNEQTPLKLDPIGFTEWSQRVREALVWLGEAQKQWKQRGKMTLTALSASMCSRNGTKRWGRRGSWSGTSLLTQSTILAFTLPLSWSQPPRMARKSALIGSEGGWPRTGE